MKTSDFIELVKQMRSAQKEYFKTRSRDVLIRSKTLEKIVDETLSKQEAIYE